MSAPQLTAPWLHAPPAQTVCALLEQAGFQALFVGGCVRNALLGAAVKDLDVATDALPAQVMALAQTAGIKAVPTGLDHGTVTLISHDEPIEITTFRRDIDTDGRHARVVFSSAIEEDAARRDFTMNALYARSDGVVLDPLGTGLADLAKRRLRFIRDPEARIREDYLRILRFFRFHAWYGDPEGGIDAPALDAIARLHTGLKHISAERITQEFLGLLSAPHPVEAVASMGRCGVLSSCLPGASPHTLGVLVHLEEGRNDAPDPVRRLAALGGDEALRGLRLSRGQAREIALLREAASGVQPAAELGYRLGAKQALSALLLRAALLEVPLPHDLDMQIARGAGARFPVSASDLMPAFSGAALGAQLKALEARWIASQFRASREALLDLGDL